ncbi:uncharacterized protein LOC106658669 [Trichogramma pretiosum]|uniref:uncharacterized protein LOC106658669 n=1 Tax=Trichogramma pretiosum TaxID=7493 RepID=UPI0006C9D4AA|nr:uncharacterized protein LOC106658669 [Trichogramma pretiosum]
MRFSPVQEDDGGVSLWFQIPLDDFDEYIMAASEESDLCNDNAIVESSMESNLPLLFAKGFPASLETMDTEELEKFIIFMVQCSFGNIPLDSIRKPPWWPKEISFALPVVRPPKELKMYQANLKKVVLRCYTYHRSEYLLRFCKYLSQYPKEIFEYVNNWDSTTSLFLKPTGKLLVTFRNENMNYDRKAPGSKKTPNPDNSSNNFNNRKRPMRLVPFTSTDESMTNEIYLCDNCDEEFVGEKNMKEHEKLCYPSEAKESDSEPKPMTPEPELPAAASDMSLESFMGLFNMCPKSVIKDLASQEKERRKQPRRGPIEQLNNNSRTRNSNSLSRSFHIPFSSPSGRMLIKNSKCMTDSMMEERVEKMGRNCPALPLKSKEAKNRWKVIASSNAENDSWPIEYKKKKSDRKPKQSRIYNFGNYSNKPALNIRSQALKLKCKPINVALKKLSESEIERLRKDPSLYKAPIPQITIVRPRSPILKISCTSQSPANNTVSKNTTDDEPICIDLDDDSDDELVVIHSSNELKSISPKPKVSLTKRSSSTLPVAVTSPQFIRPPHLKNILTVNPMQQNHNNQNLVSLLSASQKNQSTSPTRPVPIFSSAKTSPRTTNMMQAKTCQKRRLATVAPFIRSLPKEILPPSAKKPRSVSQDVIIDLCDSDDEDTDLKQKNQQSMENDVSYYVQPYNFDHPNERLQQQWGCHFLVGSSALKNNFS